MEMNKGEAEKCRDIAKGHMRKGNHAQAVKFFEKSLRLYPLPGVEGMRDRARGNLSSSSSTGTSGLHHRPNVSRSTSDSSTSSTTRSYSIEQENIVSKVKRCKTHYEVLGISRSADENQIKKGYRKLALKLHPDKNSAPGAEDAFKAVGKAFSILSDPQKRAHYDKYGSEEDAAESHSRAGNRRGHYQQEEYSPEDIFNMFFGGGGGMDRRMYRQRGRTAFNQQQQPMRLGQLLQFIPLLILFFSIFAFPQETQLPFSFHPTTEYPIQRVTSTRAVMPDIKYYVARDFKWRFASKWADLVRVEKLVQRRYVGLLRDGCDREKVQQRQKIYQARRMSNALEKETAMRDAMNLNMPKCQKIEQIVDQYGYV